MRTQLRALAIGVAFGVVAGCTPQSGLMVSSVESPAALHPEAGRALVVFLRPVGSSIEPVVYDGDRYIGVVMPASAVPFQASPGHHRFMVVTESADFLDAELEANRSYYVQLTPRVGVWRARFSLHPLSATKDAREISQWLSEARVTRTNDKGRTWAEQNWPSVMEKKSRYEQVWEQKAVRPILKAEDGVAAVSALH